MKRLATLFAWLALGNALSSTATVTAQFVGASILWSRGMLEREKLVRYAGVLYGLDPLDMTPGGLPPSEESAEPKRDELLEKRVRMSGLITDRQAAIRRGTDDIRSVVLGLKVKRERQDLSAKVFESYLSQLEAENTAGAQREMRMTFEALPPKHAKDILYRMLTEPLADPDDDVLAHVVAVIKDMPIEKMRKIAGEFKSDAERELLHEILVEIGNLDERGPQLTGTQP